MPLLPRVLAWLTAILLLTVSWAAPAREAPNPPHQTPYHASSGSEPPDVLSDALQAAQAAQEAETARLTEVARAEAEKAAENAAREAASQVVPANHGPHTDAWWRGVSICEQGGRNDPFYGFFSVMDGSSAGLSWEAQVALANQIIARYGDGAWANSCVAAGYQASPSG